MTDFVFDLDGTLADCDHRRHYIASKPKNWKAFFAGIKHDPVHPGVEKVFKALTASGATVLLCSGRPESTRKDTEQWLVDNCLWDYQELYMRPNNDSRPDDTVKEELLAKMRADGFKPTFVFDDRKKVCDMWIRNGLFLFDVSQGKGDF